MGHEYCGIVEEVGKEVNNIKPRQFVVSSFATSDNRSSPRSPSANGGGPLPGFYFGGVGVTSPRSQGFQQPKKNTLRKEYPKNKALVFSVRSDFPLLTYSGNSSHRFDRAFQAERVFALENYAKEAFSLTQSKSPLGLGIFRRLFQRGAAEPGHKTQVLQP
jgi:hypothetical protein